jgi:Ser/Thr protein kinase RdoA (MazF antagonist)
VLLGSGVSNSLEPEPPRERPTLSELAPLVAVALSAYGIDAVEIASLRYYNNATYRIVARDGAQYVLRITPNHYSENELSSEMQWLSAVQEEPGVRVPRPVAARDGRLLTRAAAPSLVGARWCSLFHWLDGAHAPEERMTVADFASLGAAASQLHRASARFAAPPAFERPRWDETRWFDPLVHHTYQRIVLHVAGSFAQDSVARFEALAQRARARMCELRSAPHSFGLIHADFHAGNYLFHDGSVGFIDFEDLGWGYFQYDIATALFGALERSDYPALVQALGAAYAGSVPLPDNFADDVLLFQVVRAIFLTSLTVGRDDPRESAWWQSYVVGKLRRLLSAAAGS